MISSPAPISVSAVSQTIPIAKQEPEMIMSGDNVSWTRLIDDYPSTGWTLNYVLRNQNAVYTFAAAADSGGYLITLTTATTAAWKPGTYFIEAYVSATGQRVRVKTAFPKLTITPDLGGSVNGGDTRTWAEKCLEAVETTILQLTTRKVESASVLGDSYTLANVSELFKLRERFKSEVSREQQKARLDAGLGAGNKIGVRFKPLATQWPLGTRAPWQ